MIIKRIDGATRVIGESQGYLGLPLRDEMIECSVNGPGTPCMVTAWEPTPEELAAIGAGAPILLRVLGTAHPPVMLYTGEAPQSVSAAETPAQPVPDPEAEEGWSWSIVEVMGHRRHAGRVREELRYGVPMVRVDVPVDGDPEAKGWRTHFYPGSALFGETPCTKEAAMKANKPSAPPARLALTRRDYDLDADIPF